ncbi:MAG TPA: GNAT family N-acetyltransferase [Phenylobacterium sp.]|nr:GNAT family N-acetyltransferase [Phenylobacterium sp.]
MSPPSQVLVRATEPEDIPAVTEVMNQPRAVWGTLQVPFVSVAARRRRFEATPPGHLRLVAVIDGKVVGTAGLEPSDHPRRAHAGSIGMAVHDAYSGRGAGTALMAAMVEQADRWLNLKRLELNVYADNARAIALYERFGFEREGLHRAYAWRDGAYVDSLAMARLRL